MLYVFASYLHLENKLFMALPQFGDALQIYNLSVIAQTRNVDLLCLMNALSVFCSYR